MTDAKERSVNIISKKLYLCTLDVEGLLSVSILNFIRSIKQKKTFLQFSSENSLVCGLQQNM